MHRLVLIAFACLVSASSLAGDVAKPASVPVTVVLETSHGDIAIELFSSAAPKTTANFLEYVRAGFYSDSIFHRVIPDFMIQGGGFDADLTRRKTRDLIENEADNGLENDRGSVAMARTQDPHSAGAQFFINLKDNDFLNHRGKNGPNWGYAVFGRVVAGMDVVDKIAATETGRRNGMQDVPLTPIVIKSAHEQVDPTSK